MSWGSQNLKSLLLQLDRRKSDNSQEASPSSLSLFLTNGSNSSNSNSAPTKPWRIKRPHTPVDTNAKRSKQQQQLSFDALFRSDPTSGLDSASIDSNAAQCSQSDDSDDNSEDQDEDDAGSEKEEEDDDDDDDEDDHGEDGDDQDFESSKVDKPNNSQFSLSLPTAPEKTNRLETTPLTTKAQHYVPSQLARSKMGARPSAADDVALFKQIEASYKERLLRRTSSPTGTGSHLSQQHIRDATRRSWELLQKANARRQLSQTSTSRCREQTKNSTPLPPPPPPPPPEQTHKHKQKLPIDSNRTIVQYTVFETQKLPLPFDGQLRNKVLRRQTFLDKHKANRFAARLMPKAEYASSAAIARIECDYGMADNDNDPDRDGMFLGRVYYANQHIKFVYVDRELQQLGTMSVADLDREVGERDLAPAYVGVFLAARYDVFVVLKQDIQPDDGRIVVYAYDEGEDEDGNESSTSSPDLGSHFQHILQGSYTTLAEANIKAIDAFEKWTKPPSDRPRLDALIYHRDYIQPDIAERRKYFADTSKGDADGSQENADANRRDVESVELSWEPPPQFGYSYSLISVVVTKSQMEGPLDLTGAFIS